MKIVFRIVVLMFAVSTLISVYSLSSFTTTVNACRVGWNYCVLPDGTRREGSPGNMSGCSVRSYNPFDSPDVSAYVYTCDGSETTCYYAHRCPNGSGEFETEEPPQN